MKRFFSILALLATMIAASCMKEGADGDVPFSIYGTWGMLDGTITEEDGSMKVYQPLGPGDYYEIMEFKTNGTYTETFFNSAGSVDTGVFTYKDSTKELNFRENGTQYFVPSHVTVISGKEMTLLVDFGRAGIVTKHYKKIN